MQSAAERESWSTGTPSTYVLRDGVESDKDFVAKAWAQTFRASEGWVSRIESGFLWRCIYPAIRRTLEHAKVRVAAPPMDDLTIYGYAVLQPDILHFVYVRSAWRKLGIAKELLSGLKLAEMDWGTQSLDWLRWGRLKWRMRNYRPFFMYELEEKVRG